MATVLKTDLNSIHKKTNKLYSYKLSRLKLCRYPCIHKVTFGFFLNGIKLQEMPPPGSYEVAMSYQNSQLQGTERTKPRTDEAKRKHGSFLSAASRFAPPRDVINHNNDPDLPGKSF